LFAITRRVKEFETLTANEPAKPKVFGIGKWRIVHEEWKAERGRLLESLNSDLESLGVKRVENAADMIKADKEAVIKHERLKDYAAAESLRLHPGGGAIIREDDARREREERDRREAEEARERIEKEKHRRFRASILELAAKFGHEVPIVTNAQEGRTGA
jgi:hypothetical protein